MSKKHFSMKRNAVAVACGLALAAGAFAPAVAMADGNTGSTEVSIASQKAIDPENPDAGEVDQLAFEVPTKIPFAAQADGTLVGPAKKDTKIVNKSVFPIHVTKMDVKKQDPFNIVDDVANSGGKNDVQFSINGEKAAANVDLSAKPAWNMGYEGSDNGAIELDINNGKIARVTADLSKAPKAATITWTLASGNAQ